MAALDAQVHCSGTFPILTAKAKSAGKQNETQLGAATISSSIE